MFLHVFVSTWVVSFVLHGAARLADVHVHGSSVREANFGGSVMAMTREKYYILLPDLHCTRLSLPDHLRDPAIVSNLCGT